MVIATGGHDLWIYNDLTFDDEIWNQRTDGLPLVSNWETFLLRNGESSFHKLYRESILVELLVQARLQLIQHRHGGTDDLFTDLFVYHLP